jgi:hypothetical protein
MQHAQLIKEHMEVLGSDGQHVGTVYHLEGKDKIKLTKSDEDADGLHHFIPLAWVDAVDTSVHLKKTSHEAKREWKPGTA